LLKKSKLKSTKSKIRLDKKGNSCYNICVRWLVASETIKKKKPNGLALTSSIISIWTCKKPKREFVNLFLHSHHKKRKFYLDKGSKHDKPCFAIEFLAIFNLQINCRTACELLNVSIRTLLVSDKGSSLT
jgi:hypothetical protein